MPTVIINGNTYEGEPGERLMDVARRNAEHTGFLCGGIGVCQTCICRVDEGSDQLSPINEVERRFVRRTWLDSNHRMACQATLRGGGRVAIETRAEQMRRELLAIFSPPEDTTPMDNARTLLDHVGRIIANQLILFPANAAGAVQQIVRHPPSVKRIQGVVTDAFRVSKRMVGGSSDSQNDEEHEPTTRSSHNA